MLANLIPQLRDLLLEGTGPTLRRLYPTAHPQDAVANKAYDDLVHDQLLESRLAALDTVEAELGAEYLDEQQLTQWMNAVNSLRLVLGTRLDVSEGDDPDGPDDDDPDRDLWLVYHLLTEMLALIVDALED